MDTQNSVVELPFGSTIEGKKEGCFMVLTAKSTIYENYDHVPPETMRKPHRVVLMVARWDGLIGFPGGTRDAGETLEQTLRREAIEEANFFIGERPINPLCTHHIVAANFVVHAYHVDLGLTDTETLRDIIRSATRAQHFLAEGSPFWLHLEDYGRGKGCPAMMASTALTRAVREELEALLKRLFG